MAVEPLRRRARQQRSYAELAPMVDEAQRQASDAVHRVDLQALTNQRIETELGKIAAALAELAKVVGKESVDDYGRKTGSGVVGGLMRLEESVARRFRIYDALTSRALGFAMGITVGAIVVWWLLGDRIGVLFKPH